MAEIATQVVTASFTLGAAVLTYAGTLWKGHLDARRESRVRFRADQLQAAAQYLTASTDHYYNVMALDAATDQAETDVAMVEFRASNMKATLARDKLYLLFPPEARTTLDDLLIAPMKLAYPVPNETLEQNDKRRGDFIDQYWEKQRDFINEVRAFLEVK